MEIKPTMTPVPNTATMDRVRDDLEAKGIRVKLVSGAPLALLVFLAPDQEAGPAVTELARIGVVSRPSPAIIRVDLPPPTAPVD